MTAKPAHPITQLTAVPRPTWRALTLTLAALALACATAPVASRAAEYRALPVCRTPSPGRAGCLAFELAPRPGSSSAASLPAPARARLRARELAGGDSESAPAAEAAPQAHPVTPEELHSAYGLPDTLPQGAAQQTIALVDAYNDPHAEGDLKVYDEAAGLTECTATNGCFAQVNQNGEAAHLPFPQSAAALAAKEATCAGSGAKETEREHEAREAACGEVEEAASWGVEISTDVDVAHSICENCRIRLVEAASSSYPDLEAAERTAARPVAAGGEGASVISNSWGGEEPADEIPSSAFNDPGIVVTAAAGDFGYLDWTEAQAAAAAKRAYYSGADYPASSPDVVAVGATKLTLSGEGSSAKRALETVWNEDPDPEGMDYGAAGGGCSAYFAAPEWQTEVHDWSDVGCGTGTQSKRAVADVSADGDPYSGVYVYDSSEVAKPDEFLIIGGTSVASPIIAATFALAGGANGVAYPAQTLYSHLGAQSLYDVTAGGNGKCDGIYDSGCAGSMNPLSPLAPLDCGEGVLICNAASGYDGPTGVGTPNGLTAFEPGGETGRQAIEEKQREEKLLAEKLAARELEERQHSERAAEEAAEAARQRQSAETTGGANTGAITGTNPGAAPSGTSIGPAVAGGSSPSPSTKPGAGPAVAVRLTSLGLTPNAVAAIRGRAAPVSRVAFAFTLSAAARVRVTLARRARVAGTLRWVAEPETLTALAHRGRNRLHLQGRALLDAASYRLTLTPAGGDARTLTFTLG
ncbi:MAG TPA: S53 family peptidase [Solirubrobacteraceae bacterium]|jgi:hypothetical protein|nr:S53 family peptidase [Solirubrobacteraceae bacterium]